MRILKLELMRILKSRRNFILIIAAFIITIIMAYLPISFTKTVYLDENGKISNLKGTKAINYIKETQKDIAGTVTSEKVYNAIEICKDILKRYNAEDTYDLPEDVYCQYIIPISPLLRGVYEVYADDKTGKAASLAELNYNQSEDYYLTMKNSLISLMKREQQDNINAQKTALTMFDNVEKPYVFYPGYNIDAMDYELLLGILLLIICAVISAPVFSSDYQTKADDILRCTKHGQIKLGVIKTISALGISCVLYTLCISIYLIISNSLFGWECTKNSIQIKYSILNLIDWNIGEFQIAVAFTGLLAVIATICFILLISSKSNNTITSMSASLIICIAPALVCLIIPGNLSTWINSMLPSGMLGLQCNFLYEVVDYNFLNAAGKTFWTPYLMIFFACIEVFIFMPTAIYSYIKHEVK